MNNKTFLFYFPPHRPSPSMMIASCIDNGIPIVVMASRNGKKSSGLRMLWIPGGRKHHPKGRFDTTNKHVSYSTRQKKSEVWSLGGSRTQRDLLLA